MKRTKTVALATLILAAALVALPREASALMQGVVQTLGMRILPPRSLVLPKGVILVTIGDNSVCYATLDKGVELMKPYKELGIHGSSQGISPGDAETPYIHISRWEYRNEYDLEDTLKPGPDGTGLAGRDPVPLDWRRGTFASPRLQHPVVRPDQRYLRLDDGNEILLDFRGATKLPELDKRIHVLGRAERVNLGGPKGTKRSYGNTLFRVDSWYSLEPDPAKAWKPGDPIPHPPIE